jgi:hypothetical protein
MTAVALLALLALLAASHALGAQVVSGTVTLADSTTPVPGVIVVATGSSGATRGLTTDRGTFSIKLPAPGTYNLQLLRIGFRPSSGPVVDVPADSTRAVRVIFAAEAVQLSALNVREKETCRVNADTGLAVTRVWEEARKAMLTTQLGSVGPPLVAEWIEYDRTLDSTARFVRHQHVRAARNPTVHAFRSVSADQLAARGYVVDESGATTYYAPDADVLLSETFAATHCFHLEAPRRGTAGALIGVGFQPSRERRDRRDIEGTLWIDATTAELRTMEFRYTNLPDAAEPAHPGGTVEFLRLDDARWLVSRWNLRMPQFRPPERTLAVGARQLIVGSRGPTLTGVQVTGGEVMRVERRDTVVFRASGARVVIQVMARDTLIKAAGATATLEGTGYTAIADAAGRITLGPVLAGRYRASVQTSLMDSLGLPPVVREVEAREGTRIDSLSLPSARDALVKACPRDSVAHGEGMLRGRVRDERARPVQQAAVVVTWQSNVGTVGMTDATRLRWTETTIGTLSDDHGGWQLCGVPRGAPLAVRVVADSGSDSQRTRLDDNQPFGSVDLVLRREAVAASREARAATGESPRPRALVEFSVVGLHGQSLADVTLDVLPPNGEKRTVVTGPSGRALVPDLPTGILTVRARRVGFKPGQVAATIEPGRNTVPIMLDEIAPPTLDTVRIVGNRRTWSRLDEFETRRLNKQATVSITREDIVRRNPAFLWQMLAGIPSIQVADIDTMVVARSTRSLSTKPDGTVEACYLAIMIDGLLMNADPFHKAFDFRLLPPTIDIHGIEVFAGPSSIPLQYGATGAGKWCGMIAIWTR